MSPAKVLHNGYTKQTEGLEVLVYSKTSALSQPGCLYQAREPSYKSAVMHSD